MAAEGLHGPAGQDLLAAGVEDGAVGARGEAAAAEFFRNRGNLKEGSPKTTLIQCHKIMRPVQRPLLLKCQHSNCYSTLKPLERERDTCLVTLE